MIKYIYMFFVGLFVAVFIGTGISVFYPAPKEPTPPVWMMRSENAQITETERQEEIAFNVSQRKWEEQMTVYNRNVSIIALVCSILLLIVSLTLNVKLGVVGDGLLLGGIFTLIYGIGRGMATDNNQYRFIVSAVGLAVTLILGYLKFANPKKSSVSTMAK